MGQARLELLCMVVISRESTVRPFAPAAFVSWPTANGLGAVRDSRDGRMFFAFFPEKRTCNLDADPICHVKLLPHNVLTLLPRSLLVSVSSRFVSSYARSLWKRRE